MFGANLYRKGFSMDHVHNEKQFFWQKQQKQIISFQKLFVLYHGLLSYESILREVFVKKVSFPANNPVINGL